MAGLAGVALSAQPAAGKAGVESAIKSASAPIGNVVQHGRVSAAGTLAALGASGDGSSGTSTAEPTRVSATARGRITLSYPTRIYRVRAARGWVVARLGFTGTRRLTLSVFDRNGRRIRLVSGSSPLRAGVTVRGGTYRFFVRGQNVRRAPFTLRVSYPAP